MRAPPLIAAGGSARALATITRHKEISDTLLEHAEAELEKGDLIQASEKTWGALERRVKSIAKKRGWPDGSHRDIRRNARRLTSWTDAPARCRGLFSSVEWLHVNFYEETFSSEEVAEGIGDARELIDALRDR